MGVAETRPPEPAGRVKVGDVELAYLSEGEGPLVLLLHGFPDTAHSWDATRPGLGEAGYRAVAPFLRGYPPSGAAPDGRYDVDALGADVLGLIDALGGGPAVVVGHDWGAAAAMSAAAQRPSVVRLLVTVGIPHPRAIRPTLGFAWRTRHFVRLKMPGAARALRAKGGRMVDDLVRRWSPAWDFPPEATAAAKACFAQPGAAEAAVAYYRQMGPKPPKSLVAPVQVDTVAFAGETDGAIVDIGTYERARRHHQAAYDVIRLPGGHFMHREHPELFNEKLLEVLRRRVGGDAFP
ncbi:MAG: alpha/beta fold hydrolase [Myxococcota bacterium]